MLRLVALAAALALGWAALELRHLTSIDLSRPAHADLISGRDTGGRRPASSRRPPSAEVAPDPAGAYAVTLAAGPIKVAPPSARHVPSRPPAAWASAPASPSGSASASASGSTSAPASAFDLGGGVPRTAQALRAALDRRGLGGHAWLGKLRSVGGGRDTLVYLPPALDPARTIHVVIYMEGHGSFADDAMDHRHAAAIARLTGNTVYVAPDAPSSAHGDRTARTAYWQAGCAQRRCAGGHAAPGDFITFLDDVRTRISDMTGAPAASLDLRLSLVGFSNGGKGVWNAVTQLAATGFTAAGHPVVLADVIFADANYGGAWLTDTWRHLSTRPEAPRLTILVGDGSFTRADRGGGNRMRAAAFWRRAAPAAPAPAAGRTIDAPRLRLVPLRAGHHAIGDAAVDYLALADRDPDRASAAGRDPDRASTVDREVDVALGAPDTAGRRIVGSSDVTTP